MRVDDIRQVECTDAGDQQRHGSQGRNSPRGIAAPISRSARRSPRSHGGLRRTSRPHARSCISWASCASCRGRGLVSPRRVAVAFDALHEALESRLRSQHVEVRLHDHVDERGAPAERTRLEQGERLLGVAALRVAARGDDERAALPDTPSPLPRRIAGKPSRLERARERLRVFRRGHRCRSATASLNRPGGAASLPARTARSPKRGSRSSVLRACDDRLVVAAGPVEGAGQVGVDDQRLRIEIARALVFRDRLVVPAAQRQIAAVPVAAERVVRVRARGPRWNSCSAFGQSQSYHVYAVASA